MDEEEEEYAFSPQDDGHPRRKRTRLLELNLVIVGDEIRVGLRTSRSNAVRITNKFALSPIFCGVSRGPSAILPPSSMR
jgi:hypothetical protein